MSKQWTKEEDKIFIDNYWSYPRPEFRDKFFPECSLQQISARKDKICRIPVTKRIANPVKCKCKSLDFLGFEGYCISENGEIFSRRRREYIVNYWTKLNPCLDDNGYNILYLYSTKRKRKMFKVHRLVLLAFKGEPKSGYVGFHKNDIKTDNCLENLKCATHKENMDNKVRLGNSRKQLGKKCVTEKQKHKMLQMYNQGYLIKEIAKKFNYHRSTITKAIR